MGREELTSLGVLGREQLNGCHLLAESIQGITDSATGPQEGIRREKVTLRAAVGFVSQACPALCDPRVVARQVALSMGFSRQEGWSGLPCPPGGALPHPGIEPGSPVLQVDSLPLSHQGRR